MTKRSVTKLVDVRLSAMTKVRYTEVVEVPKDITADELNELVNFRYRTVDGGAYDSDPEFWFWDHGTCLATDSVTPDAQPLMVAFRTAHGLHIERAEVRDATESASQLSDESPPNAAGPTRPAYIRGGLASSRAGTIVNLLRIQALCNAQFQESGAIEFMHAADELSKLTGMWQGPHAEWFANADESATTPIRIATSSEAPDVETLIAAARRHGLDSEPDHEAGDLEDYLCACWSLLADAQRQAVVLSLRVKSALETATGRDLEVTEKLLHDDGIETILNTFRNHGTDEGPAAELSDLQDTLRSCWNELTQVQRDRLFGLDHVQETFENATMKPLLRYLASPGWGHIFIGNRTETTRWVYDRHDEVIVAAQALNGTEWVNLDGAQRADLRQDIHDNDVMSLPADWGVMAFCSAPSWQEIENLARQYWAPDADETLCAVPGQREQ